MDENKAQEDVVQPTSGKQDWKQHFTTVTLLSKTLAMFLFITLPFAGFWLGVESAKKQSHFVVMETDVPTVSDVQLKEDRSMKLQTPTEATSSTTEQNMPIEITYDGRIVVESRSPREIPRNATIFFQPANSDIYIALTDVSYRLELGLGFYKDYVYYYLETYPGEPNEHVWYSQVLTRTLMRKDLLSGEEVIIDIPLQEGEVINGYYLHDNKLLYTHGVVCDYYKGKCNNGLSIFDLDTNENQRLINEGLESDVIMGFIDNDTLLLSYMDVDGGCKGGGYEEFSLKARQVISSEPIQWCGDWVIEPEDYLREQEILEQVSDDYERVLALIIEDGKIVGTDRGSRSFYIERGARDKDGWFPSATKVYKPEQIDFTEFIKAGYENLQ